MASREYSAKVSFPFLWMLGLLFIALKLTDHIDWSWVWVLSPFWAPFAVLFGCLAACLIFLGFVALLSAIIDRRW